MTRPPGKKIDTWKLRVAGTVFPVQLRMVGTEFMTYWTSDDGQVVQCRDKDLEQLRRDTIEALGKVAQIVWEPSLLIFLDYDNDPAVDLVKLKDALADRSAAYYLRQSHQLKLQLVMRPLLVGKRNDGTTCYRETSHYDYSARIREGDPVEDYAQHYDSRVVTVVLDTDENRQAFELLRFELARCLDQLVQSLAAAAINNTFQSLLERTPLQKLLATDG